MTAASLDAGLDDGLDAGEGRLANPWLRVGSRVVLPAALGVLLLVVLVYTVFPIRTWLDQRDAIGQREVELEEILSSNDALRERVALLQTEAEIERLARADHNLIRPGEEAYAVLPAAPAPVRLPLAWPFTELAEALGR